MDFREYFIEQIKTFHQKGFDDFRLHRLNWLRKEKGASPLKYVSVQSLGEGELYKREFVKFNNLDKFISQLDNEELYLIHDSQLSEFYR